MQENEFEKQVRQKTGELKLNPSDAVWQKIELRIKKEKRRRWALFLLPLLLIGSLYGGYVLFNNNNSNSITPPQQQATNNVTEKNDPAKVSTAYPDTIRNVNPAREDTETNTQAPTIKLSSTQRPKAKPKISSASAILLVYRKHTPSICCAKCSYNRRCASGLDLRLSFTSL